MTRTRTYVDSGVLIAAARGGGQLAEHALGIIADTESREFVCSEADSPTKRITVRSIDVD